MSAHNEHVPCSVHCIQYMLLKENCGRAACLLASSAELGPPHEVAAGDNHKISTWVNTSQVHLG